MCCLKSFFGGLNVHKGDLDSTDNFSIFAGKMFYALNWAVPGNIDIEKINNNWQDRMTCHDIVALVSECHSVAPSVLMPYYFLPAGHQTKTELSTASSSLPASQQYSGSVKCEAVTSHITHTHTLHRYLAGILQYHSTTATATTSLPQHTGSLTAMPARLPPPSPLPAPTRSG